MDMSEESMQYSSTGEGNVKSPKPDKTYKRQNWVHNYSQV